MNRWCGVGGVGGKLTVPSSFHVALNPLFNRRNVLLGILEIFSYIGRLAACDEAVLGRFARFGVDGPAAVLDTRREVVGPGVSLRVLQIQVFRAGRRVVREKSAWYESDTCMGLRVGGR